MGSGPIVAKIFIQTFQARGQHSCTLHDQSISTPGSLLTNAYAARSIATSRDRCKGGRHASHASPNSNVPACFGTQTECHRSHTSHVRSHTLIYVTYAHIRSHKSRTWVAGTQTAASLPPQQEQLSIQCQAQFYSIIWGTAAHPHTHTCQCMGQAGSRHKGTPPTPARVYSQCQPQFMHMLYILYFCYYCYYYIIIIVYSKCQSQFTRMLWHTVLLLFAIES